jgi:hypothetical protein
MAEELLVEPDAIHLIAGGLALLVIFAWCCPWHSAPVREAFGRWRSGGLKKHQQNQSTPHRIHGNRRRFQLVTQLPKVDEEPEEYISSTSENCAEDEDNDEYSKSGRPCGEECEPSIADQLEEQVSRQKDDEEEDEVEDGLLSSHLSARGSETIPSAVKEGRRRRVGHR